MTDSLNANFTDDHVDYTPPGNPGYVLPHLDTTEALAGAGAIDFPDHLWIDPKDWKEVAALNDLHHTWPDDFRNRFTHQGNTTSCTCQSLVQCFEIIWNTQRGSKSNPVWMSPLSVYAEADPTGRRGSYMQRVLRIAMERGLLPDNNGPEGEGTQRDKFAHTMHQDSSAGPWVPLSRFPPGWKGTSRFFRPLEAINISEWTQHVCLILNGYPVAHGRWGHAMPGVKIVWRGNDLFSVMSDSYNRYTYDSVRAIKAGVGGAFSIASTTIPEDWDNPTGE